MSKAGVTSVAQLVDRKLDELVRALTGSGQEALSES